MPIRNITLALLCWIGLIVHPAPSFAANCRGIMNGSVTVGSEAYTLLFPKSEEAGKDGIAKLTELSSKADLNYSQKAEAYMLWLQAEYPGSATIEEIPYLTDVLELSMPIFGSLAKAFGSQPVNMQAVFSSSVSQISRSFPPERFVRSKGKIIVPITIEVKKFGQQFINQDTKAFLMMTDIIERMHSVQTWHDLNQAVNMVKHEILKNKRIKMSTLYAAVGNAVMNAHVKLGGLRIEIVNFQSNDLTGLNEITRSTLSDGKIQIQDLEKKLMLDLDEHTEFALTQEKHEIESQLDLIKGLLAKSTNYQLMISSSTSYLDRLEHTFDRIRTLMNQNLYGTDVKESDELYKTLIEFQTGMSLRK